MARRILLVVAVVALGAGTLAFAAGLGGIGTGSVGNAAASVNPCQSGGFSISSYTTSAGNVTQAVVAGIQPACSGGSLQLTLTDASGAQIGSGPAVTIAGATATVALTQQPYAGNVAGFTVVITGP